jgi:hypothetical protein
MSGLLDDGVSPSGGNAVFKAFTFRALGWEAFSTLPMVQPPMALVEPPDARNGKGHSLALAAIEYRVAGSSPGEMPLCVFSQRRGNTSSRPRNRLRKSAIFSAVDEAVVNRAAC